MILSVLIKITFKTFTVRLVKEIYFILDIISSDGDYSRYYNFDYKGEVSLKIFYSKYNFHEDGEKNHYNVVTIKSLSISGASIGGGIECKLCPFGSIRKDLNLNECEMCKIGEISNEQSNIINKEYRN